MGNLWFFNLLYGRWKCFFSFSLYFPVRPLRCDDHVACSAHGWFSSAAFNRNGWTLLSSILVLLFRSGPKPSRYIIILKFLEDNFVFGADEMWEPGPARGRHTTCAWKVYWQIAEQGATNTCNIIKCRWCCYRIAKFYKRYKNDKRILSKLVLGPEFQRENFLGWEKYGQRKCDKDNSLIWFSNIFKLKLDGVGKTVFIVQQRREFIVSPS